MVEGRITINSSNPITDLSMIQGEITLLQNLIVVALIGAVIVDGVEVLQHTVRRARSPRTHRTPVRRWLVDDTWARQ